jgi:hypothetical protein
MQLCGLSRAVIAVRKTSLITTWTNPLHLQPLLLLGNYYYDSHFNFTKYLPSSQVRQTSVLLSTFPWATDFLLHDVSKMPTDPAYKVSYSVNDA